MDFLYNPRFIISILLGLLAIACCIYFLIDRDNCSRFCKRFWQNFDYIISKSEKWQITTLIIVVFLVFFIFFLGSWLIHPLRGGEFDSFGDRFWNTVSNFLNPGNFGRKGDGTSDIWVLVTGVFGMIFLGGILISVISNMLERRIDKVRNGQVHYKFSNHIVIIGYDKMVVSLIKQFIGENNYCNCEIVLQTNREVPVVQHELFSNIEDKLEKKITIISGNRSSEEDLKKLRLPEALEIFILGENGEYDHDSLNMECLKIAAKLCKKNVLGTLKKCYILLEYQSTYAIFQQHEQLKYDYLDVVLFNFYELWARKVLVGGNYLSNKNYPVLDRERITEQSEKYVHLVIVAATRMGVSLAVEAARIAHYANYKKEKTKITIIDANAKEQMNIMHSRYAAFFEAVDVNFSDSTGKEEKAKGELSSFIDIEINFIEGNIESPAIRKKLEDWSDDSQNQILTIAVCFNDPPASLAVGLYLPDKVYVNQIPVLVRLETSDNILQSFENTGKYKNVYAFGMTDRCYEQELVDDVIPQFIQYIYYNQFDFGEIYPFPTKESLANAWKNTSVVHKWSNRYNTDMIPGKLRTAGILIEKYENIRTLKDVDWRKYNELENILAKMEHNRWNVERLLSGYRFLNDERKKYLLNSIEDKKLQNNIENLRFLKEQYFAESKIYFDLWMKSGKRNDDEAVVLQKKAKDKIWKEKIRPAKMEIESMFYHDCIAPYEKISDLDQYSDVALVRGIKWIITELLDNKKNLKS